MRRAALVLLVGVCASGCVRRGKIPKVQGAAWLNLFAHYDRVVSSHKVDDQHNRGSLGVSARGLLGRRLAYCAGFEASFGASEGAFVYDASLYLLGGGVRLGRAAHLAVCAGAGLSGAAGAVPFAWQLPVEATLAFDVGGRIRPSVSVRGVWLLGASARRDGSATFSFADEVSASAGVRLGKRRRYGDMHTGNGYFVGVTYAEQLAARYVGLTFGHAINAGN